MSATVAAFFDMDKTLLRIDSGMSWTKFLYRRGELQKRTVAKAIYWSALYKLALLDMDTVFTKLCQSLTGAGEDELREKCQLWYRQDVERNVAVKGRAAIAAHRAAGHMIVLATGSTQYAAAPVARGEEIEHVLSSKLEVRDGKFTGRPAQFCFGAHKVQLAEQFAATHNLDLRQCHFYSDSFNDLPMLSRVGTAIAVNPDVRLKRHALRNRWRIETWS
jgi:HAD superfamily hydrolase (TIGR01490 family)